MNTTPQPHVHKDKISQYIKDTTQKVWYRPQSTPNAKWALYEAPGIPSFKEGYDWHVGHEPPQEPEKMKLVFEGNAPWRVEPAKGTRFWFLNSLGIVSRGMWERVPTDLELLAAGNCWKTEADAIAYRDAYRAATHGETK